MTVKQNVLLIGVDVGGSKTHARLISKSDSIAGEQAETIADAVSGPGNPRAIGFDRATVAIGKAIDQVLDQANAGNVSNGGKCPLRICIAAAGAGRSAEREMLTKWAVERYSPEKVIVTDDAQSVLAAASPSRVGIALVCGTGSFAWGRNQRGECRRCGGWGYLLGDEGSGFWIAVQGLNAALRASDRSGPPTSLLTGFLQHVGIRSASQLVDHVYREQIDRRELARLSQVVIDQSESDPVAGEILDSAAVHLAELVSTLVDQLGFDLPAETLAQSPAPVLALSGGLLVHQELLRARLLSQVDSQRFSITTVAQPVVGAIRLAAQ